MSKQIGILSWSITAAASAAFVLTWSSGFLVAAIGTADASPLTLLLWRFVLVAVILTVAVIATGAARTATRDVIGRQALIGLFAQFGYCVFVYAAIGVGIATGTTALIDAVQPLVVATLVGPVLGLRVRAAQWIGLALGAGGVLLVVRSHIGGSDAPLLALALPALAMACLIVGTFLERRTRRPAGVLLTLAVHVAVTTLALVVLTLVTGTWAPPASASFWVATVVAALSPTLAAYGLYWWLLRRIGVTAVNALLFLVAPTTAIAGAILLGEPLTPLTLVGFALCGTGVAAVLTSEAHAARRAAAPAAPPKTEPRRLCATS